MKTVKQLLAGKSSQLHSIRPDAKVIEALQLMAQKDIGALVVMEGGRLVGILSERDYARKVILQGRSSKDTRVADIMTREVVSIDEMATLAEIADLLETKQIKRVPVVHDGRIVGIVSRADLLQVLASGGVKTADEDRDRTIRDQLLTKLRSQKWADASEGRVVVSDGVVHFWGIVGSEAERKALRVAAENTPGVLGIEDHTIL